MKSPYRGWLLVVGSMIGGGMIQVTMWACGDVSSSSPDAHAAIDAVPVGDVWSSYTPTITTNGSPAASQLVRGGAIRYVQIGKTVCLQGFVAFGERSPGTGGSFVKISVPPGLPGAAGVTQYGLGPVTTTGDSNTLFLSGAAAIETADVANFILVKESADNYVDGDARSGRGFNWVASGCYESN